MKLALVTPNFAPHFEGGTERVVRAQAAELVRRGHEVRVVSGTHRPHAGEDREQSDVDGLSVVHLAPLPDEPFDIAFRRPRLVDLCRSECADADLVHVHHWAGFGVELVRPLAEGGRPVAITFHDLFATCTRSFRTPIEGVECPERGDVEPCVRCLLPEVPEGRGEDAVRASLVERTEAFDAEARAASLLVAPSATHARDVERLLGLAPQSVRVVPNGLCVELGRAAHAPYHPGRPLRVLHLGHRATAKGTLDLVRALGELPPGSVELLLAGTCVEPGFDERLVAEAGGFALELVGGYAPEDLPALAAGCDLAALPSRARESYGLVVDEALALGLPVWVSDRGALHERVGAAGRVLPAENPRAWASAFRGVLDNPGALEAERAAVPAELPTGADAARALEALYRDLLP